MVIDLPPGSAAFIEMSAPEPWTRMTPLYRSPVPPLGVLVRWAVPLARVAAWTRAASSATLLTGAADAGVLDEPAVEGRAAADDDGADGVPRAFVDPADAAERESEPPQAV